MKKILRKSLVFHFGKKKGVRLTEDLKKKQKKRTLTNFAFPNSGRWGLLVIRLGIHIVWLWRGQSPNFGFRVHFFSKKPHTKYIFEVIEKSKTAQMRSEVRHSVLQVSPKFGRAARVPLASCPPPFPSSPFLFSSQSFQIWEDSPFPRNTKALFPPLYYTSMFFRLRSVRQQYVVVVSSCTRSSSYCCTSLGALLVVREEDFTIVQASANAAAFLDVKEPVVGTSLQAFGGDLWARIRPHLDDPLLDIAAGVRCTIGNPPVPFDGLLHRPPGGGLVIELERAGPNVDLSRHVEQALKTVIGCSSLKVLCDETARLIRDLTGYDRVMVYRFDDEGHGEVFSESKVVELEPFLGNWYPSSDIPRIARRLYERNRVRVLVDVGYAPAPLEPQVSPITGQQLDMSLCFLRSMSPLHIQYLKNMGVGATLVISLMVGGKLWGLVACHHYEPRFVHFEVRAVCELLAEAVATRIAALDAFVQAQAELAVRRLEQRMVDAISRDGDWRAALFDNSQALLVPVGAMGAAALAGWPDPDDRRGPRHPADPRRRGLARGPGARARLRHFGPRGRGARASPT